MIRRAPITPKNPDPMHIPGWLDDPQGVSPCPCGAPPEEGVIVIKGDHFARWMHPSCMSWLRNELTPEEIIEMEEFKRRFLEDD